MNMASPFLVLNSDCDLATQWLTDQLQHTNLSLLRTFSSKDVRAGELDCLCPHHGPSVCNCQIVIFLVYKPGHAAPISLVVHGYDQYTVFYVVDTPQQQADPALEATIRNALIPKPGCLFSQVSQTAE